jgi:hypothetical protein
MQISNKKLSIDAQLEFARTAEAVLRILEDNECTQHVHIKGMEERVRAAEDRLVQMQSKAAYVVSLSACPYV